MTNERLDDIIKENSSRLSSFVKARVGNSEDAEDIVQETFYQFIRTVSILDNPIGKVTSWLYTVAHNIIINHGKKRHEQRMAYTVNDADDTFLTDISEIMIVSDSDSPDMQMLRNMVWEEIDKALAALPQEQRKAIELTEIEGVSTKEAAERMGVTVNTFLSRKHYAVVHIRRHMHALYEELIGKK